MIEINLIPDVKRELLKAQRTRTYVISGAIITSIIAGAVIVLLLIYIYGFQGIRSARLDADIERENATLTSVEDLSKILTIQNQLAAMSGINEQKKIDSRIFDVVAAVVPPGPNSVAISGITLDAATKTITLEGQTRAFDSMEVFKKTIDSAIVEYPDGEGTASVPLADNIDTGQVSYGTDANNTKVVIFTLSFEYPEELFSTANSSVTIRLSVNGNVTDSYLGIPRAIFTTPAVRDPEN
jgi:hypothetical protein